MRKKEFLELFERVSTTHAFTVLETLEYMEEEDMLPECIEDNYNFSVALMEFVEASKAYDEKFWNLYPFVGHGNQ